MQINITALKMRGESAKYFKIKIGDIKFNGAMFDYADVFLRIAYDYVLLGTNFLLSSYERHQVSFCTIFATQKFGSLNF